MLLNHIRVTHERLSSQENTDAIPPGKLTSIYLQNTVAVFLCIVPFLRKEKLAYTHSGKVVLASPKLYAGSKRSVQAIQRHFAFAITKDPFCLSVFNTA